MSQALLTINAGSSSIKFAIFDAATPPRALINGQVERIGTAPRFIAHDTKTGAVTTRSWETGATRSYQDIFDNLLQWVEAHLQGAPLIGVGHRVVHGGQHLGDPVIVTPAIMAEMESLIPLAPLHQPHSLHAMQALAKLRPGLPQVACFDTAFHRGHADAVRHYALPRDLTDSGIERYGFHGLSYEFIAGQLKEISPKLAQGHVVVGHLGNGASLCALQGGRSVDSTMGFTAVDGLPMGTRCGAIDPGVILYLQQARNFSVSDIEDLIYHKSGLLGISGISADMRTLLASKDPHAAEAVNMFCYRIATFAAAMATAAGGLDAIVFTAGIGEKSSQVRARACAHLQWLGVELDAGANDSNAQRISTAGSKVTVLVIPTDEEAMIARHAGTLLGE